MKKLIFVVFVIAIFSTVLVSCTKQEINDENQTTIIDDGEIDDDDI